MDDDSNMDENVEKVLSLTTKLLKQMIELIKIIENNNEEPLISYKKKQCSF